MRKQFLKAISFALASSITVGALQTAGAVTNTADSQMTDNSWKVSESLRDLIVSSNDDTAIPTIIWLNDISQEKIQTQASEIAFTKAKSICNNYKLSNHFSLVDEFESSLQDNSSEYEVYVNQLINTERQLAKSEYEEYIADFVTEYIPDDQIIFQSSYAPMVIASLLPIEIDELANAPIVSDLSEYVEMENVEDEETMNNDRAFGLIDSIKGNSSYFGTGAGIKIGQIESDIPDVSNSDLKNSNIHILSNDASKDSHATNMARFMVGINGMAPDATLYCVDMSDFFGNIEMLIDNGVNVINMSTGYTSSASLGKYAPRAKWIDHLAANHHVAFVKSAGNRGNEDKLITAPGMAYNAITVGNVDEYPEIHLDIHSSTDEDDGIADKPDFTMIGGGSSQASAITTGIVALMMEKKPALKNSTRIIKALLAAGSIKEDESTHTAIGNTGSIMTDECGAGFINPYRACSSAYFTKTISTTSVTYNTTTARTAGQRYRVSIAWHANSSSDCNGTVNSVSMNQYELKVYQGSTLVTTLSNSIGHNNNLLAAEFLAVSNKPFSFVINRTSGTETDGVCVAYKSL